MNIIMIIIVGLIIYLASAILGAIVYLIFKVTDLNLAGTGICAVAAVLMQNKLPNMPMIESIFCVATIALGIAAAGIDLYKRAQYGRDHSDMRQLLANAVYYGNAILLIITLVPQLNGLFPSDIDRWCWYAAVILSLLANCAGMYEYLTERDL